MRKSRIASLSAFLAIGTISLPLLASTTSAVAASPRTAPAIGTQLAELKGSDTVLADGFSSSVAISGTAAVVDAPLHPATTSTIAGVLSGVTAASASNAWAVGITGYQKTLIVHWNGTAWTQVPSPSPGPEQDILSGVAATSADSAWAVGYTGNGGDLSSYKTLILHWNGITWKQVPSPGTYAYLTGVAATSATNAWAVGSTGITATGLSTLILHWNGTAWTRVPSPSPRGGGSLHAVAATSTSSAWAVGCSSCPTGAGDPLILRWNGAAWKQVPSPSPAYPSSLYAVAATSADNAWAVGCSSCQPGVGDSLSERWNGTTWKQVPSPSHATLQSVAAVSTSTAAWAVGSIHTTTSSKWLILRWNGAAWKQVPSPSPAGPSLSGVAATSADNAWAVGGAPIPILHWNGTAWK